MAQPQTHKLQEKMTQKLNRRNLITTQVLKKKKHSLLQNNFLYDSNNNLVEKLGYMYEDGQWREVTRFSYTYDSQKNRTSEIWQYFEWNGELENLEKWTCSYDENNNAISGNYQYWDDDIWVDDDEYYLNIYYNNMQSYYGYSTKRYLYCRSSWKFQENCETVIIGIEYLN